MMGMMRAAVLGMALLSAPAVAQSVEHHTLDMAGLRALVERGGLDVVAIERETIMVSKGAAARNEDFPARLQLAGCDPDGQCRVVRIYTRYVIGDSAAGHAALTEHSKNFTGATYILTLVQEEPAVDVGRDASLERGRTDGEVLGEIATAMSDAQLLRDALMASDPFLRVTLGRP
jgi:hypothetical protein